MEQVVDKVEVLREELRRGRRDKTGESTVGHGASTDGQAGSGVQAGERRSKRTHGSKGSLAGDKRSADEVTQRVRQSSGRPGDNGGSAANRDQQSTDDPGRIAGSIERIDSIPERIDNELPHKEDPVKKKRGRPAKPLAEPTPQPRKSFFKEKRVLSSQEATELLEPLAAALIDYGGYIDKYLKMQSKDPDMPDIWGDLTELEANVLARIMIRRGQKSPAAAEVVRNMVDGADYASAIVIVVPRVMKTADLLKSTRKMKKVKIA